MWVYYEDDWKAEVEILEDLSDEKILKYKLKVVRTIQESKIFKPTPDGDVFVAWCKKDYENQIWILKEEAKDG